MGTSKGLVDSASNIWTFLSIDVGNLHELCIAREQGRKHGAQAPIDSAASQHLPFATA